MSLFEWHPASSSETQELSKLLQQYVPGNLNSVLEKILLFISETSEACIKILCASSKLKVTEMELPIKRQSSMKFSFEWFFLLEILFRKAVFRMCF